MRLNVRVEFAADTMVPLEQTATMVEFADTMVPSITDSPSHLSSLFPQHTSATNTNTNANTNKNTNTNTTTDTPSHHSRPLYAPLLRWYRYISIQVFTQEDWLYNGMVPV